MRRTLTAAAAVLLMNVTAAYAVTQAIQGTFSLTYTPDSSATGVTGNGGATGAPIFSSTPGDGAVGNGTSVYNLYGSNTFGPTASNVGFSQTLTVGAAATTLNFFTADPASTCGSGCATATNSRTGTTNTQSGTITATFTFTTPSGATGNMTDTAAYYADYNTNSPVIPGKCTGGSASQTDCIIWSTSNDPIVITFSDGYTLTATLNNAQDWNITPTISLALSNTATGGGHQTVPEPASFAVLCSAILGLGLVRRRRK